MRIALLGVECTGKTRLAVDLAASLRQQGKTVAVVDEVLRDWCVRAGREPRPEEQLPIAREQERRVNAAAASHEIVVADTSALMVAIYGGMMFPDSELLQFALERQRLYDFTLLTGLDLPWVADGLQREVPEARGQVDALIRDTLERARIAFRVVYGRGPQRAANALAAIDVAAVVLPAVAGGSSVAAHRWQWNCEKCSDPQCEHRLFTRLRIQGTDPGSK